MHDETVVAKLQKLATDLGESADADVLIYTGPIDSPYHLKLIDLCNNREKKKDVLLFLVTFGGDPDVAYRIARHLQQSYVKFTIYICGYCKSAGTLLAMGAHEIVMTDKGEMGPLDVQVGKKDEIWETDSGLTVLQGIETLEEKAFLLFEDSFLRLKTRSGGRITLKTATELASALAIGIVSPIIAQIDPMHIGEVSRAMKIGYEYGERLSATSKNTKDGALKKLTYSYPSHGFVIDRQEAEQLFRNVRQPNPDEVNLVELVDQFLGDPAQDATFFYLSNEIGAAKNGDSDQEDPRNGTVPKDGAAGEITESDDSEQQDKIAQFPGAAVMP
ncbi:SDH family Clp fold serine proteinase [Acidithiobacillus sp.]